MHSEIFLVLAVPALAELRASDVPSACATICRPVVELSNICNIDNRNKQAEEATEAQCICTNRSFNVGNVMALCASCIAQNRGKTQGKAEGIDKIMSRCCFPSASFAPSANTVVSGIRVQATKPASTVPGTQGTQPGIQPGTQPTVTQFPSGTRPSMSAIPTQTLPGTSRAFPSGTSQTLPGTASRFPAATTSGFPVRAGAGKPAVPLFGAGLAALLAL